MAIVVNGDPAQPPRGPWTDRVAISAERGVAFRPGEVVTGGGDAAFDEARKLDRRIRRDEVELGPFIRLLDVPDPLRFVEELRVRGIVAQPNHVVFAHGDPGWPPHPATAATGGGGRGGGGCGCCCCGGGGGGGHGGVAGSPVYASPVYASPVYASPVYASPVYASPVYASPVYASPVYASPVYASPVYASPAAQEYKQSGVRKSSVRPAQADASMQALFGTKAVKGGPRVVVLDTGLSVDGNLPPTRSGSRFVADAVDRDAPDEVGDGLLDPAAGHGTFIGGLVDRVAPGCGITLHRVLSTFGDGDEVAIAERLLAVAADATPKTIVNLSFGGYTLEQPFLLAWAVRQVQDTGAVVVASAGNDGTCRPTYPAALPGVVSVGAVGPTGPAPFSNYGPWVRACAPGVDLVSPYFQAFDGSEPLAADGADPDRFDGWGCWSGTSFAAPVVVGALARAMLATGCTAAEAVARVVDAPGLLRIPDLGTVVNLL